MTIQQVTATYSGPSTLQSTDLWEQLRSALVAQLPLRNLHWKSPSRPSIRTVQELQINFIPYEPGKDEHASQVPATMLEKPLLHLYIVTCEDAESYKTTVKKQIKDWLTLITLRKNQEWLVVHVISPDNRSTPGTFLKMKGAIIDKIRADFNVEKRDRCVQLAWSSDKDHPAAWVDLITKMKEGVLAAFDSVVSQREEEVKRSEGQRQMPGWNFCTYFILKESLAALFEGMGLFDDALTQYDELESTFFQVLREKNLSWFGILISPSPGDDSSPLLSLSKKSYRDLILANSISIFDFRIYLLARQCSILGMLGRVIDVVKKSSAFIASFSKRLREAEGLPEFFIESWMYSSAISIVDQCDEWADSNHFDKRASSNYQSAKGELFHLAANQLDVIGISMGYLPFEIPFSMSMPSAAPIPNGDSRTIQNHQGSGSESGSDVSRPEIVSAIADKDVFYDLYVNITKRAIDLYAKAGRRQFALKLHATLAALDVYRGRLPKAHQTYSSLPGHYIPHGWTSLGCYMHYRAIKIHSQMSIPRDREWIHVLLDFLKAYIVDPSQEFVVQTDEKTYVSDLIDSLRIAASGLQSDSPYYEHPAIAIRMCTTNTMPAETRDGSTLDVSIRNRLSSPILIDEIRVVFTGPDSERLVFSGKEVTLNPGSTVVNLLCSSSTSGLFLLDNSELRIARLLLQWNHKQKHSHSRIAKELPTVIRILADPQALDITMSQPRCIELGAPQKIHVTIATGRNHVSHISLQMSSHPGIKFDYSGASNEGDHCSLEPTNESLVITEVEKISSITFVLPYSGASDYNAIKVDVRAEYVCAAEPSAIRTLRISRVVPTMLAVAVNVEDFFRDKRLFSRFTISTTSHQHVRIRSAQLETVENSNDDLKIVPFPSRQPQLITATPKQPCHFLFRLECSRGQVRDPLRLRITYRLFRKEVEALIEQSVSQVLSTRPNVLHRRVELVNALVKALENNAKWTGLYGVTSQLEVPETADLDGELGEALHEIKEVLRKSDYRILDDSETWREIIFPVDVPQMNIVAAVRMTLLSTSSSENTSHRPPQLYAGQPITAILSIRTSFNWGSGDKDSKSDKAYMMRFDVEELLKDWLVSGQKRGDFLAKDGESFSVPITLVALHHGELSLPRASVTPLPIAGGEMTMRSMAIPACDTYQEHGAEKVLVLPRGGRSTFFVNMGSNIRQQHCT